MLAEWEKSRISSKENNYNGICPVIHYIPELRDEECKILLNIIRAELIKMKKIAYLFPSYQHQPRVEWLKKQIELCEEESKTA